MIKAEKNLKGSCKNVLRKNERNGEEIHDASVNLAIEYYLLNEVELDEPILLFYINDNSIIIGKNQNTYTQNKYEG